MQEQSLLVSGTMLVVQFSCDGCGQRYRVSDQLVRGRTVRMQCKKCKRIIQLSLYENANLDAVFQRARAASWLRPEATLERLGQETLDWLQERADEHLGVLLRFLPKEEEFPAARVLTTRDRREACVLWSEAWLSWLTKNNEERQRAGVVFRALRRAIAELTPAKKELTEGLLASLFGRTELWRKNFDGWLGPLPPEEMLSLQAAWVDQWRGQIDRPSPWEPLFAMWERGAWPLMLPEGTLLIYVPVLVGERIIATLDAPEKEEPFAWLLPRALVGVVRLLRAMGLGVLPTAKDPSPEWWIEERNESAGPFSEDQLVQRAIDKTLNKRTYVWREGFDDWAYLENVQELSYLLGSTESLTLLLQQQRLLQAMVS